MHHLSKSDTVSRAAYVQHSTHQPQLSAQGEFPMHLVHPAVVGQQQLEEVADEVDGQDPQHRGEDQRAQVLAHRVRVGVDAAHKPQGSIVLVGTSAAF